MWEDFKVGIEHLTRWERSSWILRITQAMRLFSFLMPGVVKLFSTSESERARSWIVAEG